MYRAAIFTVYGPWGRPDMALFLFTRAILADEPIQIFNHGKMQRDFTYIDDIVEGVMRVTDKTATGIRTGIPITPIRGPATLRTGITILATTIRSS